MSLDEDAPAGRGSGPRVFGYSPLTPVELAERVERGASPSELPGDFVLADGDTIVTSAVAAVPYFYYASPDGTRFVHGPNVFEVVREAGIPWRWNARALASLLSAGHTAATDTLHADVHRVPCCATLRMSDRRLSVSVDPLWSRLFEQRETRSADAALEALTAVLDSYGAARPAVSVSGGYDSRAILSYFLGRGIKPITVTMGSPGSTDAIIGNAISQHFGTEHRHVQLAADDYFTHGETITALTGGSKTAGNWHTYLYTRAADLPRDALHFVGANGEFARTYYLDRGNLALALDKAPATPTRAAWFRLKFDVYPRLKRRVDGSLGKPLAAGGVGRFFSSLVDPRLSLLDGLDYFYARERVRHFVGNGLALYQALVPTCSPFLDARWLASVAPLTRKLKMSSEYHRLFITRSCRELGRFPIGTSRATMDPQGFPTPPSWVDASASGGSYSVFPELLRSARLRELICDSEHLPKLIERSEVCRAYDRSGPWTAEILMTLHFCIQVIRSRGIAV